MRATLSLVLALRAFPPALAAPLLAAGVLTAALAPAPADGGAGAAPGAGSDRAASIKARIASDLPHIVERWIALSEIPAPSGQEGPRGARIEKELRELGLEEV